LSLNNEVKSYQTKLKDFAKEREWEQFHSPKNIACALSVEASELLEIFQWLSDDQSRKLTEKQLGEVRDEVSDVFLYLIKLADMLDINLSESLDNKMIKNEKKYPAEIVKGSSRKYTEY
jgi:NTP pyrophosphatase (non-canonical NTP hydrolase)